MILPIKDGVVWNGLPADLSNLPQWGIGFSQSFGGNPDMYKPMGLKGHNGLDLYYKKGTPIVAPIDMTVQSTTTDTDGYGIYVRAFTDLVDDEKLDLVFGHLDKKVVKAGDKVKQGDLIGYGDSTGFSTGHHLHFGIRVRDKNNTVLNYNNGYFGYIDPEPFLPKVKWTFGELEELRNKTMIFKKEKGKSTIYQTGADGMNYPINSGETFKRLYGEFDKNNIVEVDVVENKSNRLALII